MTRQFTTPFAMASSHTLPIAPEYFTHFSAWPSTSSSLRGHKVPHSIDPQPDTELGIELDVLRPAQTRLSTSSITTRQPTVATSSKQLALYRLAVYWPMFIQGWNDATAGPLLPTIQAQYGLNFTTVSMLLACRAMLSEPSQISISRIVLGLVRYDFF